MKRLLLDILIILLVVSIVSTISKDPLPTFDDQIQNFEQQIEDGVIYQPNKEVYVRQIEENYAGKFGSSLSKFVVDVIHEGMDIVKEIVSMF